MCLGLEAAWIPLAAAAASAAIGSGVSAYGAHTSQQESEANAMRVARARNNQLESVMRRNKEIADQSREIYKTREQEIQPENMAAKQEELAGERIAGNVAAVAPPAPENIPISGSAPTVVKSEVAKKLGEAMTSATDQAKNLGKLGSWGDFFGEQGMANTSTGRDLGVLQDFQQGNLGILPMSQDFAAYRAYRPSSGIGEAMQAAGPVVAAAGSAAADRYGREFSDTTYDPLSGWTTTTKPTLRGLPNYRANSPSWMNG